MREGLFGRDGFDRIFISYSLSMIPPWRRTVVAALDALAPGGSLHIVDFGEQEAPARLVPRRACAPGSAASTSRRVILCAKCWNRNASGSAQPFAMKRFIAATPSMRWPAWPDVPGSAAAASSRRLPCFGHLSAANRQASNSMRGRAINRLSTMMGDEGSRLCYNAERFQRRSSRFGGLGDRC